MFANKFRLERLLMCVTLVSLVYLSLRLTPLRLTPLLSLLYESLLPQLSELTETPHQPENQRTGARGAYAQRQYEVRRSLRLAKIQKKPSTISFGFRNFRESPMRILLHFSRENFEISGNPEFANFAVRVLSGNKSSRKTKEGRISLQNGKRFSTAPKEVALDVPAGRVGPAPANRRSGCPP